MQNLARLRRQCLLFLIALALVLPVLTVFSAWLPGLGNEADAFAIVREMFATVLPAYLRTTVALGLMVAVGAVAIALLVWFGGPLVAIAGREPLATPAARLWALLALAGWWCLVQLWHWWQKRRRQAAFAAALSAEEQALDAGTARELSLMRERLQQALMVLRGGKFGRGRSLYQLTEPIYRPIRRILPNFGGVDLSPLVVLVILFFLEQVIRTVLVPAVL